MKERFSSLGRKAEQYLTDKGFSMRAKLILIFVLVQVLPLILLTVMAWQQVNLLGDILRESAVEDAAEALNDSAVENIERMSTDTATRVAEFLYARDDDIRYLATIEHSGEAFERFSESKTAPLIDKGEWVLNADGTAWEQVDPPQPVSGGGESTNKENEDMDGYRYREPENYPTTQVPLYDEITYIDLNGQEVAKYVNPQSTKERHPFSTELRNVSDKSNTYIKAEDYFSKLQSMKLGDIYVSDVIGAYVGANYIGMYTPEAVTAAAAERGYEIPFKPEEQAYAGEENPNGQRFEGIVRWATPVADDAGNITGYVTFALNHDHIMEFVDHITPMNERYTQLPSAFEGNYAFIWDYNCRSICHPRHHSITGYDPATGEPQIPWLETSIYEGWKESGMEKWTDYTKDYPEFNEQSREKKPAAELTKAGLVGLDGRYLNNAPQCTGWMDLTGNGGSGSFYILWSGIYKLNTAAAIPYYTGQYAPSADNDFSRRGFGFVAIGSGLEDFTEPARVMEDELTGIIHEKQANTTTQLVLTTLGLIAIVVLIAILLASSITGRINNLIRGISRFREGERQFRFNEPMKDEFGDLADSFDDMADSIVDSVKNPLAIINMDKKIVYMNESGLDFCKMSLAEAVGSNYADSSIYPPDSLFDPIRALAEGREAEAYYLEEDDRYLRGKANYLLDKDEIRRGYIIETIDMTEIVKEQIHIEEQRSLLDKIFASSPDLIWYLNDKGEYYTVNPRFACIAGQVPEAFTGKTAEDMLPADLAARFQANDNKAIESSSTQYAEERVRFADGHEEVLDSVRTPIYDPNGAFLGVLGFARNVTSRVEMEAELRDTQLKLEQAVDEANAANEHKGEFLARMSHEIRTPMNAIIGLTGMVEKKLETQKANDDLNSAMTNLDKIKSSSQHLLGLLNDILDLSKIEAGRIELSAETVDLLQLGTTVEDMIRLRCEEKDIHFETTFVDIDPPVYRLDSLRLRQVLINLLGNAVKFTPECGTIRFEMHKRDEKEGHSLIEFIVVDNGIGIAEESIDSIFESFEQGNRDVAKTHGGTGLGLAISKRIVELFGGNIILESTLGEGSTFRFSLWLEQSQKLHIEETSVVKTAHDFSHHHLLLVDDVEINRLIVTSLLEETGIAIDEAKDGQVAYETFKDSPIGYYDIILMDIQMPVLGGYEATEKIRKLNRPDAKTVPIVAQTANAFKEDIERALSHGMNDHLAKPIDTEILLKLLYKYLKTEH